MSQIARPFILLVEEVIARIEDSQRDDWWCDIDGLTERMEYCRLRLGISLSGPEYPLATETPAFLVCTFSGSSEYNGILCSYAESYSQLKAVIQDKGSDEWTVMISFDPFSLSATHTLLWDRQESRLEGRLHGSPSDKVDALCVLRSWLRAATLWENTQTPEQPTPSDVAPDADSGNIERGSDEWRDRILDRLNGQQLKLFKILWNRQSWTYFSSLKSKRADKLWRGQPDESAIDDDRVFEALRKLQKELPTDCPYHLTIERESSRTRLEKW